MEDKRIKALKLLAKHNDGTDYLPIDYVIDDECRRVLNLPARPPFSKPYTGWMVGGKKNTNEPIKISDAGIELIKRWEGLRIGRTHLNREKKGVRIKILKSTYPIS